MGRDDGDIMLTSNLMDNLSLNLIYNFFTTK